MKNTLLSTLLILLFSITVSNAASIAESNISWNQVEDVKIKTGADKQICKSLLEIMKSPENEKFYRLSEHRNNLNTQLIIPSSYKNFKIPEWEPLSISEFQRQAADFNNSYLYTIAKNNSFYSKENLLKSKLSKMDIDLFNEGKLSTVYKIDLPRDAQSNFILEPRWGKRFHDEMSFMFPFYYKNEVFTFNRSGKFLQFVSVRKFAREEEVPGKPVPYPDKGICSFSLYPLPQ